MVAIETNRLILREFVPSDWEAVHDYSSDPEVCRFLDWGPHSSNKEAKEFINRALRAAKDKPRSAYDLAITQRQSDKAIGSIGLILAGFPPYQAVLGYVLNRHYWGKGIVTESVAAMISYAFETLHLHRVAATCDPANIASYRVMEKCGMKREGHFIEDKFVKDKWRDTLSYSILARQWQRRGFI